jgi:hypothetical protein
MTHCWIAHDYGKHLAGKELFSFNTTRIPVAVLDINSKTEEIINIKKTGQATAWQDVPTPAI